MGRTELPSFESIKAEMFPSESQNQASYASTAAPKDILRDPRFVQDLRDYYRAQGLVVGAASDEDLIEKFYSDRNWADLNTVSAAKDVGAAYSASPQERERMRRLQEAWRQLPNIFQDGGRPIGEALPDIAGAIIADPINLIGGLASKPAAMAATTAARAAGRNATSAGLRAGVSRAALTEGAVSGAAEAGFDALTQARDIQLGLQEGYSPGQTALAAGVGATIGGVAGGLVGIPGAFAGVRGGEQLYQDLVNIGIPDTAMQNLTARQVTDLMDPVKRGEFLTEFGVDTRGTARTAADVPFEEPEVELPVSADEGVASLDERYNALINTEREHLDRLKSDGVPDDVVNEQLSEITRLVNLQSMPARLQREREEIVVLAASEKPEHQAEAVRRRIQYETDYADYRAIVNGGLEGRSYDETLARLTARMAEIEEDEAAATKPAPKTKAKRPAKNSASNPGQEPQASQEAQQNQDITPDQQGQDAAPSSAEVATEQVPEQVPEPTITPEEAARFPAPKEGAPKELTGPAQKELEKRGITLTPEQIETIPATSVRGKVSYNDMAAWLKANFTEEPPAAAVPTKSDIPPALRKQALLSGIDYKKVATDTKDKKPASAVRSAIKQRKPDQVDTYVTSLSRQLDDMMARAADAGIDDLDEAKSVMMGWAKEEGIDTDDLQVLLDDLILNTRKEGLLEDDIAIEVDLTKAEKALAKRRANALIADGMDPDFAERMTKIEVASERGKKVEKDSPRGSSQKWERAGELTTAGRTAEGRIQSFLRRGMPISKGSDYTISGMPFPTRATFDFEEAIIRAQEQEGPDLVAFKASGNENVVTTGGGPNRVPRGTIAFADGVTGKAYESQELAMAMRPEGMRKGESITADELGGGKAAPAAAAQRARATKEAEEITPIPTAPKGEGLLLLRNKTKPTDVRMENPNMNGGRGQNLQDIIGKSGQPADWEIKYAPADSYTSSVRARRKLWDRVEDPAPDFAPTETIDTSPEADGPPPRAYESVAGETVAPLTADQADALNAPRLGRFAEGDTPSVRDIMALRHQATNLSWRKMADAGGAKVLARSIATASEILARTVPEGITLPTIERAEAASTLEGIFKRHAPEEVAVVRDRIMERLGGDRSRAPAIVESRTGSSLNTNYQEDGEQFIKIDPSAAKTRPPSVVVAHEIAHWAYHNILTDADRAEFWRAMEKYEGSDMQSLQRRAGALPAARGMEVEAPDGSKQTLDTNAGSSPQELFANQFETWFLNKEPEGSPLKNMGYWQKIGRYFKAIFDRYFSRVAIDPDLEPLFAKILPDVEMAKFKGGVDRQPTTKAGASHAKRMVEVHAVRDELEDAIARGSHDGILNGYREMISMYFSMIGDKREKTGVYMPARRYLGLIRQRIADFDEIMGTSLASEDAVPEDLLDIGSGSVMSGDVADRIEILADFYENGYAGKFQPSGGVPPQIKNIEATSPKALLDNLSAAIVSHYKRSEKTGKLPPGAKPRYKQTSGKVSKSAKKATLKVERETHKDLASAMSAAKEKSAKAAPASEEAATADYKAMTPHALRMAYKREAQSEAGQHIARELMRKMNAEDLPKTKVNVSRNVLEASGADLEAMYLDGLYRGDRKLTSETSYELRRRSKNKKTKLSRPITNESIEALAREREDSIGIPDNNGIPPAARAVVREFLSYMTHRDPDVEYTLRTMAYRMLNLMGRTAKATIEDANLMSAGDVARIAGRPQSVAGGTVFADFRSPEFAHLRNDLRRMAVGLTKGKTDPLDMMHEIGHVVVRSGAMPTQEIEAIKAAFSAADDKIKRRITETYGPRYADLDSARREELLAEEWFSESLAQYMAERVARGDIYEQLNNGSFNDVELRGRFDRAIDRAIEYIAYVVNGLIGRNDIKQTFRRLTFYGDMLATENKAPLAGSILKGRAMAPELAPAYANDLFMNAPRAQKDRVRAFVANGFGSTETGDPVAFYHGTPNGAALSRTRQPEVRISQQGNYGPGFYVSASSRPAGEIYALGTPEALLRAMRSANPEASEDEVMDFMDLAMNIGETRKAIAQTRIQYSMQLDGMAGLDEVTFEIVSQDIEGTRTKIDRLLAEEDALMDEVAATGAEFSPDVLPVYIKLTNPVDFRDSVIFNQDDQFLSATFKDLTGEAAPPSAMMSGPEAYTWLTSEVAKTKGLSKDQAKSMLATHLQKNGHDGLLTTHRNTLSIPDMDGDETFTYAGEIASYDAPVLFSGNHVKHVDAAMYDETSPLLYNRTRELVPRGLNASLAYSIADRSIESFDDIHAASIGEEMERGGDPSLSAAAMSMLRRRPPTEKEITAMVRRGPRGWIASQSSQMSMMGANWLAGWYKGFFSDTQQTFASKYYPLKSALDALPDADGKVRAWMRAATAGVGQEQPESHAKIMRALRRGEGSRQEKALTVQERAIYQQVRRAFEAEREALVAEGIFMGDRKNYVPQIWQREAIEKDAEGFKTAMAQYHVIERTKLGQTPDMQEAQEFANRVYLKLSDQDSDGIFVPLEGGSRNPQFEHADFQRMIELDKHPEAFDALEKFLESDLDAVLVKYFDGSSRRIKYTQKMGVSGHALYDYMMVVDQGQRGIAHLLSTNKTFTKEFKVLDFEANPDTMALKDVAVMPFSGRPGEAEKFAGELIALAREKGAGAAHKRLMDVAPVNSRGEVPLAYKRRADAITGALADYKGERAGKDNPEFNKDLNWIEQAMNVAMRRRANQHSSNVSYRASAAVRSFNNITLLSYTMLTSLGDVVLPLIRSGNLDAFVKGHAKYWSDPDYREAMARTGVAIENILHQRMVNMYGGVDSKFANAFFNATLLTPWTDLNRKIAGAVGFEALQTEQKRMVRAHKSGRPLAEQSASFRKSARFLRAYGLEDFLPGGARFSETISPAMLDGDEKVRQAVIRFADTAVFAPNADDIPLWAQTPWGAVITQLKTFPLMMTRMSRHILQEADKGNLTPLIYLAAFGPASGAAALAVKDVAQMRGGEDGESAEIRKRNILKFMGHDEGLHGDENDFLGWYAEGMLLMGGLGILGDVLHGIGSQVENGDYGKVRIASTIGGPTIGAGFAAITGISGIQEVIRDNTDSNYKERAAMRELATRIPGVGGNRAAREAIVDATAGKSSSETAGGSWGTRFTKAWE